MSERHATITVHELTPYEVAFLAGGPARLAETAAVELIRRGRLTAAGSGVLTLPGQASWQSPGTGSWPAPGSADRELERQVEGLAWQPGGGSLRLISRQCQSWPSVRQLEAGLAAERLIFRRRHRLVALGMALAVIALAAAAGAAFAAGWHAIPTARSPLAAAAAVVAAGLIARSRQRVTGGGRELLSDGAGLSRLMLAQLPAGRLAAGPGPHDGPGQASPAAAPRDVAAVALGGLTALGSSDLAAQLAVHRPRSLIGRAAGLARAARLRMFVPGL